MRQKLATLDGRRAASRGISRSWRSSRTSSASARCKRRTPPRRRAGSRRRSTSIREQCPAYLNLGDVRARSRATPRRPRAAWERLIETSPERAYLAFARLEQRIRATATRRALPDLCRRLIAANPQDWRARLALARHLSRARQPADALELLFEALVHNPHALALHQAIWETLSQLGPRAGARRALRRADARRRLLSRPAHLHALPLPQHRAALAVPAMPRVEHVRRGAHRARRRTPKRR